MPWNDDNDTDATGNPIWKNPSEQAAQQPQQQQQQQRKTTNNSVADYFAILGVGDELIWKHDQKKQNWTEEKVASPEPKDRRMEDAAEEEERIDREIVDLIILCSITKTVSQPSSDSANLSPKQTELESSLGNQTNGCIQQLSIEDWTRIQNTLPAASPGHLKLSQSFSSEQDYDLSNSDDRQQWNSKRTTQHHNRTDSQSTLEWDSRNLRQQSQKQARVLIWPKYCSWDANLNWNFGLRAIVASQRLKVLKKSLTTASSIHHFHNSNAASQLKSKFKQVWNGAKEENWPEDDGISDDPDKNRQHHPDWGLQPKFVLAYRRRKFFVRNQSVTKITTAPSTPVAGESDESKLVQDNRPGIADLRLFYVRLHRNLLLPQKQNGPLANSTSDVLPFERTSESSNRGTAGSSLLWSSLGALASMQAAKQFAFLTTTTTMGRSETFVSRQTNGEDHKNENNPRGQRNNGKHDDDEKLVPVEEYLNLPQGFEEWCIPQEYRWIRDPKQFLDSSKETCEDEASKIPPLFQGCGTNPILDFVSHEGPEIRQDYPMKQLQQSRLLLLPLLVTHPPPNEEETWNNFCYIPIVAYRRQRIGDEERYHEDPAIVDMAITFLDDDGQPVMPRIDDEEGGDSHLSFEAEEDDGNHNENRGSNKNDENDFGILDKTAWTVAGKLITSNKHGTTQAETGAKSPIQRKLTPQQQAQPFGSPVILVRKNRPFGFADVAFATRVLDRFPRRNYKGLPLPQEELPMFCYPTGCRLFRARYSDAPLAQYYGFVVKNERGDSIYVSCVSFMEPLTAQKMEQLALLSEQRRRTSLPHEKFCLKREQLRLTRNQQQHLTANLQQEQNPHLSFAPGMDDFTEDSNNFLLTGFDDMTTFENKTICLVSRYPFWTAFRKFLSHLHILSGSVSDIPLERCISHLLLSVPLPRPGGHNVIVPLPALNEPMILSFPPEKDFPLLDLPYQRLVACLDINTVVMIVLGVLALERKIIVMSTRPSLVLDVCELLRSLLFPFELCAPYVPRLTEPFQSSLDFPGAIFVGIHDDGSPHGLAATVRKELPEDSIVVDLETGLVESDSLDRAELLKTTWDILPRAFRSELVKELQVLCHDAGIADGQEPLDSQYDSAFEVSLPDAVELVDSNVVDEDNHNQTKQKEPLDDRAFRDAFLRFFCKVLGGYERFLVVPDADFLVSGNDYFDSQGFLASVRSDRAAYLAALVSTQLFQSFIQRRTEASDVHCLLFDECMQEYHASPKPYGRLGDDVETVEGEGEERARMMYSLLVDQSAAFPAGHDQHSFTSNKSFEVSEADSNAVTTLKSSMSFAESFSRYAESAFNPTGDLVTNPSREGLPQGQRYIYCIDGNPCFPHKFNHELFLPKEPESWLVEMSKAPNPLLARSEKELEEADRRRRIATSYRGFQKQRRCLWQLPKLMGSHFLGAWLLCVPAQVSQPQLSHDQQARFLMRALGALRLLRSKQRIVPDEAAYRALMVACGRSKNDRRTELVKLFGLLRSDGIFPSAVTLGQYTRALAEGYSKQLSGGKKQEEDPVDVSESASRVGRSGVARVAEWEATLNALDGQLGPLEEHGRRWRTKHGSDRGDADQEDGKDQEEKKKRTSRSWLPVVYSSSFSPIGCETTQSNEKFLKTVRLVALWSRTRACRNCAYIPLEEEVQAGWDVVGGDDESSGAISCPRCGSLFVPMLGVREFSLEHATSIHVKNNFSRDPELSQMADFGSLPPQICPHLSTTDIAEVQFVAYKSPATVRMQLEQYVEEFGEDILSRERLKELDPELFYNFWWYCARFSLPLPLSVFHLPNNELASHYIAFAGWDQAVAERACYSAAQVFSIAFCNEGSSGEPGSLTMADHPIDPFDDHPLLSRFNLQGFYSSVWDHEELSKILVALVEACDKRDFKPVVDCVIRKNQNRKERFGHSINVKNSLDSYSLDSEVEDVLSVELDVYRTILYLAKYQCTTAFHVFFPATIKPCKGYHFWCAIGQPLPIFDRLLRDGAHRMPKEKGALVQEISDVALGFRCVFGHLI